MSDAIITAIITGSVTIIVCMLNNYFLSKQTERKHNETVSLVTYKLEQLTKKVEEHNKVVDRMYIAEKRLDVIEERGKVANHRIEDLEHMNH